MRSPTIRIVPCVALLLGAVPAMSLAAESEIVLADAPGRDAVTGNCLSCHSADYILMNSPFPDRKAWRATVTKMITVMKAPITPADADVIVDYLARNYGSGE